MKTTNLKNLKKSDLALYSKQNSMDSTVTTRHQPVGGLQSRIKKPTLSQYISDQLRQQIIVGSLPGGTQLKQELLAGQFNVSISVFREALKILESEDLIQFLPNKGAQVTQLTALEASEIYQIRIMLETGALALSIPKLTDTDLDQAEMLLMEEAGCTEPFHYNEINSQFHDCLFSQAGNAKLLSLIQILHNNVNRYLVYYLDQMHFKEQSHHEHLELLDACRAKDCTRAKRLLKKHMQSACLSLTKVLENQ